MKAIPLFVCVGLVLTACGQAVDRETPSEDIPVYFAVSTPPALSRTPVDGTEFAVDDKISLYGVAHGTNQYSESTWSDTPFMNNTQAVVTSEGKVSYTPLLFFPTAENYSFFSLFSGRNGEEGVVVTPPQNGQAPQAIVTLQTEVSKQPDVMLAQLTNITRASAKSGMILPFKHLLTQVRFNIRKATTFTAEAKLSAILVNTPAKASLTFDQSDLTANSSPTTDIAMATYTSGSELILTETDQPVVFPGGGSKAAHVLLFPKSSPDVTFKLTISGKEYSLSLPAETWGAGIIYTYNITLDKAQRLIVTGWTQETWKVDIGGSSILDTTEWDDGGTLSKDVE